MHFQKYKSAFQRYYENNYRIIKVKRKGICLPEKRSSSDHCYYLKENIGKSIAKKIHLLSNEKYDFNSITEPSSQNIIECYKKERLFSDKEYKNPVYLGEHHQVWLALDYSVTPFNRNEFSIVNPFRTYISFSAILNKKILPAAFPSIADSIKHL